MAVNIIYILIFLVFTFLIYLVIKAVITGIDGKSKNKKIIFGIGIFKPY
tara:strand:- start:437 stop:583 length:147 start_codon:yes stop_codon:yes gene_type:complete